RIVGPTTGVNRVQGNFIGIDKAGTAALPNGDPTSPGAPAAGIHILGASQGNVIGGTLGASAAPGTPPGNVISGNVGDGVLVESGIGPTGHPAGSDGNKLLGNAIGLNAAGTSAIPNGSGSSGGVGIDVVGSENTAVGGATTTVRNVVSGNAGGGIS